MAKMTLPPVNLDLTLEKGKLKAISDAATSKGTEYIVRVEQLRTIPGFNVRVLETDDYRHDLESLKQSIRENGYYQNKPLAGYVGKDGEDDVIYVTDGHRRLQAVNEINAEALSETDLTIEGLPVVLKPADSNVADLTIALVQDNSGRPLTPYELSVVVQRLQGMKDDNGDALFAKAEIARKLSITERYIDDLNVLYAAPAKVRNAVLEGSVSSTLAIQELRKSPKKAEERITAAVKKAKGAGKSRVTKKHLEPAAGSAPAETPSGPEMLTIREDVSLATGDSIKDALKALAAKVREVVGHDSGDVLTTDGKITVVIVVPAPEKTAAPAKRSRSKKANGATAPAPTPEVTSEDEGVPVKLPPAVPTVDANDNPDDI